MSWEGTSAVVQTSKQKGSGYLLMLLLANHAKGNGYSWYGVRRLAAETRLSQRNVRYLIRKSEALGKLEVFIGRARKEITCIGSHAFPTIRAGPARIASLQKLPTCKAGAHPPATKRRNPLQ
jgi:hypothetical protein